MERLIVWHRWQPPAESSPEVLAYARNAQERCKERLTREGAEVLATLGCTLVCEIDPTAIVGVVETCLALLADFERREAVEVGSLSIALTIGAQLQGVRELQGERERPRDKTALCSDAIDRAQALANQASAGELVLDGAARASMASTFLFSRELSIGSRVEGEVIDRAFPRRRECRAALAQLAMPALPASAQAPFQSLRQVALARGRHRVLVVGPYGAGVTSWLSRLASEAKPPLWLHVSAVAAPLAPLSGLAYGFARLRDQGHAPEQLLDTAHEPDQRAIALLTRLREGRSVQRREIIIALRHLLVRVHERHGARVWISVSPVPLVDPASVSVIADAARDCPADFLLVMRMALDSKPPEALTRGGGLAEIRLPALSQPEARALAQSMLGRAASHDIARRAAAMGGNTPLGVAEAVRVLISSGDVVHDGEIFRWRRGPAGRVNVIAVEEMIEERVDQLDSDPRRVLESLASVPDPSETWLVDQVSAADGVSAQAYGQAVNQLVADALVERRSGSLALTSLLRTVVEQCMPPARLAEIHRFVAEALATRLTFEHEFARATLGYYMARGGRPSAAVDVLLEVARGAGRLGFVRSGVRLAAAAVECDPTGQTRERAAQIAQALSTRPAGAKKPEVPRARTDPPSEPSLPIPEQPERPFSAQAMQQAIEAIIARDFDGVERSLELLVAAGKDGPAVDRLRAMTLLSKGDRVAAMRALDRSRQPGKEQEQDTPRAMLATALVLLDGGEAAAAVREALRALARTKATKDLRGEGASLKTLAACYRSLHRHAEADRLDQAAQNRAGLPTPSASGSSAP